MTKLGNRMTDVERISAISRTFDGTKPMFAVMLDLDEFKSINDTLGHHMGDIMLKRVSGSGRSFPEKEVRQTLYKGRGNAPRPLPYS